MKVRIELDPRGVVIKPLGRLGDSMFSSYRTACRGALYDHARRCNVANVEVLPGIMRRLRDSKFEVEATPDVMALVRGAFGDLIAWSGRAKERVEERSDVLYPFQREGAVKLASRYRFLLADEMGLGKTRQAIFAVPERAPVVVVAPAIAKGVWRKEWSTLRPEFGVTMMYGRNSFRWPEKGEIVVTNGEILPRPVLGKCLVRDCPETRRFMRPTCKAHVKATPWVDPDFCIQCGKMRHPDLECYEVETGIPAPHGLVIAVDEAHAYKNRNSQRTQALMALSNAARLRHGYVWLLTGTPLLNRPGELWDLLTVADLAREAFGNMEDFAKMFGGTKNYFGGFDYPKLKAGEDGKFNLPEHALKALGDVMLRRTRAEVMPDLPTKSYDDIEVDLTKPLHKACDEFIRQAAVDINDPAFLEKVAFKDTSRIRSALATAKIPMMDDWIDQFEEEMPDEGLVVFSAHLAPIAHLAKREGWVGIDGSVDSPDRFGIAEDFRAGKIRGIAGTIRSTGVGIRFERACHALFLDLEWTPKIIQQAEDRLMGLTQKRPVQIHRLVGDHVLERRVAELCRIKDNLFDSVISAAKTTAEVASELPLLDGVTVADSNVQLIKELPTVRTTTIPRRQPRNPLEEWAKAGLIKLAGLDADRARKRNNAGFSRDDTDTGNSLAAQLDMGLGDDQWRYAIKMCRQYWRQIGAPPT